MLCRLFVHCSDSLPRQSYAEQRRKRTAAKVFFSAQQRHLAMSNALPIFWRPIILVLHVGPGTLLFNTEWSVCSRRLQNDATQIPLLTLQARHDAARRPGLRDDVVLQPVFHFSQHLCMLYLMCGDAQSIIPASSDAWAAQMPSLALTRAGRKTLKSTALMHCVGHLPRSSKARALIAAVSSTFTQQNKGTAT